MALPIDSVVLPTEVATLVATISQVVNVALTSPDKQHSIITTWLGKPYKVHVMLESPDYPGQIIIRIAYKG